MQYEVLPHTLKEILCTDDLDSILELSVTIHKDRVSICIDQCEELSYTYSADCTLDFVKQMSALSSLSTLSIVNETAAVLPLDADIIGDMTLLETLYLDGVTVDMKQLLSNTKVLSTLTLKNMDISSIDLLEQSTIKRLTLVKCQSHISGDHPLYLNDIQSLQSVWIEDCDIEYVPDLFGCTDLRLLYIKDCDLSRDRLDCIPITDVDLCRLDGLTITRCNLEGRVPDWLSICVQLRNIDLSSNRLSGDIPQSIGQLTNLQYLDLSNNRLTGGLDVLKGMNVSADLDGNLFSR